METAAYFIKIISISAIPILLAIILHEISHGWMANRLGDPTAKHAGRLTLNPIPHIDIFGTIILPTLLIFTQSGIVFGYAKPVPINPYNLKEPKKDMILIAGAGPLANLILAVLSALVLRTLSLFDPSILYSSMVRRLNLGHSILYPLALMCTKSIQINVVLGLFNLIPIPPADGGRIVAGLLPQRQAEIYNKIEPFGMIILFTIIFFDDQLGILSRTLYPMISILTRLLIWI
ncbi:MAG: site-2 protease family protein [bacterium]|nr:site-2 protease family protein [bacterium]